MKNFKNLKFIDDIEDIYEFGEILGKGSFGSVKRAIRKGTNFEFAVKVIDKAVAFNAYSLRSVTSILSSTFSTLCYGHWIIRWIIKF